MFEFSVTFVPLLLLVKSIAVSAFVLSPKMQKCKIHKDVLQIKRPEASANFYMSAEFPIPRYSIVFMRHGESAWNSENIFTGWKDVPLTKTGEEEASAAGMVLKQEGLEFDVVYTSYLKRAIKTTWLVLDAMDSLYIPVHKDWKLNEQMYGDLEGRNKVDCVVEHGLEQVQKWRRSYETAPPEKHGEGYFPPDDVKYSDLTDDDAPDSWCGKPQTESLKDTQSRAWRLWREEIAPAMRKGKKVLVCCHGNTLRALLRRLDGIPNDVLMQLDIPRAVPLIYTLDEKMKPIKHSASMHPLSGRFLGDISELEQKVEKERKQCIPPPAFEFPTGSYMCPGF